MTHDRRRVGHAGWPMTFKRAWFPTACCLLGILFANHPMLFTGFGRTQLDHEDPRLINYLLEHGYLWLVGSLPHRVLWSPPFFYPAADVLAYSDTLLSAGPFYWPWRLAFSADTSFQLWLITCFIINYAAFFSFLRVGFGRGIYPASLGAFLFAFSAPRVNDIGHPQLLPQFYSVLAILALAILFDGRRRAWWVRLALWTSAGVAVAAQLYSSVYMGWFLLFGGAIALFWALLDSTCRVSLTTTIRDDCTVMAAALVLPTILIIPLLFHYLQVTTLFGYRDMIEVRMATPGLGSWIYVGPDSWLYGWLPRHVEFYAHGLLEASQRIGIGLVSPFVCIWGLFCQRGNPVVRILGATTLTLAILITYVSRSYVLGLALALWAFCFWLVWLNRDHVLNHFRDLVVLCLLSYVLFPAVSILTACIVLAVGLVIRFSPYSRSAGHAEWLAAAVAFCFLALTTFTHDRTVLIAAGVISFMLIVCHQQGVSGMGPFGFRTLGLLSAAVLVLSPSSLLLWEYVHSYVPGAAAIRVTTRVVLLMLIPLSLGFASAWERLGRSPGWKYAAPLALFCAIEQGITTTSFDKYEARARVDAISRVIKSAEPPRTFFYSSHRAGLPDWNDHVDAMWAGISTGVPTINGYSGYSPSGWMKLYESAVLGKDTEARLRRRLMSWIRSSGLRPEEVVWVHDGERLILSDDRIHARSPSSLEVVERTR